MAGVCAEHGRRKNGDEGMGKRNPIELSSPSRFHLCNCTKKYPYSTRAPVNLNATLNYLAFSSHLQEMSPHFQLYCQLLISLGSCAVFQSRDCERQRINQTNSMAPGSGLLWDWWTAGMCNLWFMVGLADLVPRSYLVTLTEMYNRLVLKGLGTRLRFRNNYVSSVWLI